VFGLPRRLTFDAEELARRYYELSRLLHPDRHTSDPAAAREASTQNTAALTRAHRTLRDPVARALYWLELHGEKLGDDNRVPAALAALVFAVQEKLEELRRAQHIERQKQAAEVRHELADLKSRHDELSRRLQANFCRWDEPGADRKALLAELKSILSQRAYLATLIRDASATLDGGAVEPAAAGERHSRG
jgi:molecular chaperone HscB